MHMLSKINSTNMSNTTDWALSEPSPLEKADNRLQNNIDKLLVEAYNQGFSDGKRQMYKDIKFYQNYGK